MEALDIIGMLISILSLMSTISCIIAHYILPKIQKNPGNFVLIQAYIQLGIDVVWILISIFPDTYFHQIPCELSGAYTSTLAYLSYFFHAVIATEIVLQLRSNSISSHTKRKKVYFIAAAVLIPSLVSIGVATKSFGANFLGFCFYKENSVGTSVYFIFDFVFLAYMWYSMVSCVVYRKSRSSKIIFQYIVMLTAFNAVITLMFIVQMYALALGLSKNEIVIQNFLTFSLGFILAAGRLCNYDLLRELKWKIFPKSMSFKKVDRKVSLASNDILNLDEEPISIAQFFELNFFKVTFKQNLLKILLSLSLRFSEEQEFVIEGENYEFLFTEQQFSYVIENSTIKDFTKRT